MAGKRDRLSGNEAIAIALRQINPDVVPGIPDYSVHRDSTVFRFICSKWTGGYRIYPSRE